MSSNQNANAFKALFLGTILSTSLIIGLPALGIVKLPPQVTVGFPGMQVGLYGYQPRGGPISALNSPLHPAPSGLSYPGLCNYQWNGLATTQGLAVKANWNDDIVCLNPLLAGEDTLYTQVQTNLINCANTVGVSGCPSFWSPTPISYYLPNPSDPTKALHVVGSIQAYSYNTNLGINTGANELCCGQWKFSGDTIWLNLADVNWNLASTDPSIGPSNGATGTVYEAPLFAQVANFNPGGNWNNNNCNICTTGAALSFFAPDSTGLPNTQGVCATLIGLNMQTCQGNQNLPSNSTLSSIYAPDSRMTPSVFYPISISQLMQSCSLFGCSAPQGQITITLYTLLIGQYIVQNPSHLPLGVNPTSGCTGIYCFTDWLKNPWNQLLLGLGGLLAAGIVGFILLAIFAAPLLIALIYVALQYRKNPGGGR